MKYDHFYLALDGRPNPHRRLTDVVRPFFSQGDIYLRNIPGNGAVTLPILDEHPDFLDDEEEGIVRLPAAGGLVTLLWPTMDRYYKILSPAWRPSIFPKPENEADIQTNLGKLFQDIL